jgi:cytochrome bd-type quinol oxidase subunit 2
MEKFTMYIAFIYLIKVGFILMSILHIYLAVKGKTRTNLDKEILYWKERFEFIFIIAMALLLIYLFNPIKNRTAMIDYETTILLYLFGFILIITAKWDLFFTEPSIIKKIQASIGPST